MPLFINGLLFSAGPLIYSGSDSGLLASTKGGSFFPILSGTDSFAGPFLGIYRPVSNGTFLIAPGYGEASKRTVNGRTFTNDPYYDGTNTQKRLLWMDYGQAQDGNSYWVAQWAADASGPNYRFSTDFSTWDGYTISGSPTIDSGIYLPDVDKFVLSGRSGSSNALYIIDTPGTSVAPSGGTTSSPHLGTFRQLTYGNSRLVMGGHDQSIATGTNDGRIYGYSTSAIMTSRTEKTISCSGIGTTGGDFFSAYDSTNSRWVAIYENYSGSGSDVNIYQAVSTDNTASWTESDTTLDARRITCLTFIEGYFYLAYLATDNATYKIVRSTNGASWTEVYSGTQVITTIFENVFA